MRVVPTLLLLLLSFAVVSAQNPLKDLQRVRMASGVEFIRVNEWCEAADFTLRWRSKDDDFSLFNRTWQLSFSVDSRKAQINGMQFLLSHPVILRSKVPYISHVDLQTTIQPMLFPPVNLAGKSVRMICLDPGHGGSDPGNINKRNREKDFTLLLSIELEKVLRQAGLGVVLTRVRDQSLKLSERAAIANRHNADLFVSLHYNSTSSSSVKGAEVYCMTPAGTVSSNSDGGKSDTGTYAGNSSNEKNMLLAYQIQRSLLKNLSMEDRGIKRARFEVLREVKMPAVLIEGGFMSNATEAKRIYDPAQRKQMALAIAEGILNYKRIVERNAR